MGLCRYSDFTDGSLSYRDVVVMIEYAKAKSAFVDWKIQHDALKRKR